MKSIWTNRDDHSDDSEEQEIQMFCNGSYHSSEIIFASSFYKMFLVQAFDLQCIEKIMKLEVCIDANFNKWNLSSNSTQRTWQMNYCG